MSPVVSIGILRVSSQLRNSVKGVKMKKKIIDLETLSDRELLEELVNRLLVEHESALKKYNSELDNGGDADPELAMDNDEDWCRIREVVRFVKKDNTIWEC